MLDAYIDDFGEPKNGRKKRWDYSNENPTTYWIWVKGWNEGNGIFGDLIWITGLVSLITGFMMYTKSVNTSKIFGVIVYVLSVIYQTNNAIFSLTTNHILGPF